MSDVMEAIFEVEAKMVLRDVWFCATHQENQIIKNELIWIGREESVEVGCSGKKMGKELGLCRSRKMGVEDDDMSWNTIW